MTFDQVRRELFSGSILETEFIGASRRLTAPLGFTADNTLACIGVCRDEICQPLVADVHQVWGEAFILAGLGGLLFCGRTALQVANSYAPVHGGRERSAYLCLSHIGIGPAGEPGYCVRPTREGVSSACGALTALHRQLEQGPGVNDPDPGDIEQSLLTQRLMRELDPDQVPSLVELTKLACAVIATDLERAIEGTVDTRRADYCVFTGVQIHAPDGGNFVWPAISYAVVDGQRHDFDLSLDNTVLEFRSGLARPTTRGRL